MLPKGLRLLVFRLISVREASKVEAWEMREWPDIGPPAPQRRGLSLHSLWAMALKASSPKEDFKFKERKKTKKWNPLRQQYQLGCGMWERGRRF